MNKESNDLFLLRTDFPDPAITPNQSRMHTTTALDWGPSGQIAPLAALKAQKSFHATQSKSKKTGTRDWGVKPKENEFMGQPETQPTGRGFRQMYVSWRGTDDWEKMMVPRHLFFSPKALGIENSYTEGQLWRRDSHPVEGAESQSQSSVGVPVELLCWPLEPAELYAVVNLGGPGAPRAAPPSWENHREEILQVELDPSSGKYRRTSDTSSDTSPRKARVAGETSSGDRGQQFLNHRQLALYFQAQIELFGELCLGRSYHAINQLEQVFSYASLIGLVANDHLPLTLRASFVNLLSNLYINRYPHDKLELPGKVQILRNGPGGKIDDSPLDWSKPDAIPHFAIDATNTRLLEHPQEHFSHPDPRKFELLQLFISHYFTGITGKQAAGDTARNAMTLAVMRALTQLLQFGFYAQLDGATGVHALLKPLCGALDGRLDRKIMNMTLPPEERKRWAKTARYQQSASSALLTSVKAEMCMCLSFMTDISLAYRVQKLMGFFRNSVKCLDLLDDEREDVSVLDKAMGAMLIRPKGETEQIMKSGVEDFFERELQGGEANWCLTDKMRGQVRGLFEARDGRAGAPLGNIDLGPGCELYEHNALDLDEVAKDIDLNGVIFDLLM
jgi:hypothetical protein